MFLTTSWERSLSGSKWSAWPQWAHVWLSSDPWIFHLSLSIFAQNQSCCRRAHCLMNWKVFLNNEDVIKKDQIYLGHTYQSMSLLSNNFHCCWWSYWMSSTQQLCCSTPWQSSLLRTVHHSPRTWMLRKWWGERCNQTLSSGARKQGWPLSMNLSLPDSYDDYTRVINGNDYVYT